MDQNLTAPEAIPPASAEAPSPPAPDPTSAFLTRRRRSDNNVTLSESQGATYSLESPGERYDGFAPKQSQQRGKKAEPCDEEWGCWELIYSSKGTLLGIKPTLTLIKLGSREALDTGFVATYATEHFGLRNSISAHFAFAAALGGGTAGNEGSISSELDVGYLGMVNKKSGPFVRGGVSGTLLQNDALSFRMFEPLRPRLGYQIREDGKIIEFGITQGFVPIGRYNPDKEGVRRIARATELSGYFTAQLPHIRAHLGYTRLFAESTGLGSPLSIARASFCDYHSTLTACADLLWLRGDVASRGRYVTANSLYLGLTFALSP